MPPRSASMPGFDLRVRDAVFRAVAAFFFGPGSAPAAGGFMEGFRARRAGFALTGSAGSDAASAASSVGTAAAISAESTIRSAASQSSSSCPGANPRASARKNAVTAVRCQRSRAWTTGREASPSAWAAAGVSSAIISTSLGILMLPRAEPPRTPMHRPCPHPRAYESWKNRAFSGDNALSATVRNPDDCAR